MTGDTLRLGEEVEDGLAGGRAVVALESTVLAHGLPRPRNLEVGRALEAEVRAAGAIPATVAFLDGVARVGLTDQELERIATDRAVEKLSTRDLGIAAARKASGGTTVAATAFIAGAAGIQVFATGGIGGVHRGTPLDVSADLYEMHRTQLLVVCSGAKSILDLSATREALETLGIPVLGWQTEAFPQFYARGGDLSVDARVDGADEVAAIWSEHVRMRVPGGVLLCVPVPAESAIPADELERVVERALADARRHGIAGKALTPFLLTRVAEETGGGSLEANVALLRRNAAVAAECAVRMAAGS